MLDTSVRLCDRPSLYDHADEDLLAIKRVKVIDDQSLGHPMSGWRRLLEEESEHQWLSFAAFSIIVIIGAVLIDWSSDLSGVRQGSSLDVEGTVIDSAGDSVLYQSEDTKIISHNGNEFPATFATCLEEHEGRIYACLGNKGTLGYIEDGNEGCETTWCEFDFGTNLTATHISADEDNQFLMIVQTGTSDSIAAVSITESAIAEPISDFEGAMHLDTLHPTSDGWLVGGSWQAPPNWLGSNPTSPPRYELVLHSSWDGTGSPSIEIIHMGDEGTIHGIYPTGNGYVATGTSDTVFISDGEINSLGLSSHAATNDQNGNVWLFGGMGSTTVAVIYDDKVSIEKLPEPLQILPNYATCDDNGMISVHGSDYSDDTSSFSIDSNARTSFTSLRGILDLGFILISVMILSIMGWNVIDAIRRGEVF
ncbi:MAG: hypothetical protein CMB55_02970 [Euryarchaeota archaeon]|nr:hypothetical protein [Euryarchaeota archaeon]